MWLLSKGGNPSQFCRPRAHSPFLHSVQMNFSSGTAFRPRHSRWNMLQHSPSQASSDSPELSQICNGHRAQQGTGNPDSPGAAWCQQEPPAIALEPGEGRRTEPGKCQAEENLSTPCTLLWGKCEPGQRQERHHRIHLLSSIPQGTSCSCSSGPLLLTRELDRRSQHFFFFFFVKILTNSHSPLS